MVEKNFTKGALVNSKYTKSGIWTNFACNKPDY